jgi:hypothetical protein
MEVTAVVLHDGALAHYDVTIGNGGICTAHLSSYRGADNNMPPERVVLRKEGRSWVSDINNSHLSEDLGYAVELKARPILQERKRQDGHPAE